ncbi:MAG TPA: hypothetical protein VMF90_16405 [Rhizobiaceae bacterium]|nr:hypothetical protein [Rhizobiaceae bacterium]
MAKPHSIVEARRIQKAFEERFAGEEGILGIGIRNNAAEDDLALSVSVTTREQAAKLPADFEGLEVVVDVVGEFRAD